jgi:catechol 2,3-dioxygenase-like lactoylglutathione lyase family enzyme
MGIHHITAIAGDPQRNLDFYAGFLGMRLIKLTVNFDDPASYHLYYGDEIGHPGSILTFFPWPHGRPGRQGTGQAAAVALSIPSSALGFWIERLIGHQVKYEGPTRRFDEQVLAFSDPDGLLLELVAARDAGGIPWADGPVPPEHAIRGLHGTTIWEDRDLGSTGFLETTMGFEPAGEDGGLWRFR